MFCIRRSRNKEVYQNPFFQEVTCIQHFCQFLLKILKIILFLVHFNRIAIPSGFTHKQLKKLSFSVYQVSYSFPSTKALNYIWCECIQLTSCKVYSVFFKTNPKKCVEKEVTSFSGKFLRKKNINQYKSSN